MAVTVRFEEILASLMAQTFVELLAYGIYQLAGAATELDYYSC